MKAVDKIHTAPDLVSRRAHWHRQGKSVVFTNGVFDLLHPGHTAYLEQARALGDVLIVAINSDASAAALAKGPARPIQREEARAQVVAALQAVSAVVVFDEPTPTMLIERLLPDVLVKGGDYDVANIAGADAVIAAGGRVLALPFVEGHSTTAIEQRILKAHGL